MSVGGKDVCLRHGACLTDEDDPRRLDMTDSNMASAILIDIVKFTLDTPDRRINKDCKSVSLLHCRNYLDGQYCQALCGQGQGSFENSRDDDLSSRIKHGLNGCTHGGCVTAQSRSTIQDYPQNLVAKSTVPGYDCSRGCLREAERGER